MIFRQLKTQSAFTLVELMVGIGVSAAAMLATATSVTNSLQASKRNEHRTQASISQVQVMNDVLGLIHESLEEGSAMSKKTCTNLFGGDQPDETPQFNTIASTIKALAEGAKTNVDFLTEFAGYKKNKDIALSDNIAIKIQSIQFKVTHKETITVPVCKPDSSGKTAHCNNWAETPRPTVASPTKIADVDLTYIAGTVYVAMGEMRTSELDPDDAHEAAATFAPLKIPLNLYFSGNNLFSCSNMNSVQACKKTGGDRGMLIKKSNDEYICDTRHATNHAQTGCVSGKMFQKANGKCETDPIPAACTCAANFKAVKMTSFNHKGYRTELYQCMKCFQKKNSNKEYKFGDEKAGGLENDLYERRDVQTHLTKDVVASIVTRCRAKCNNPCDVNGDGDLLDAGEGPGECDPGEAAPWRHSSGLKCCVLPGATPACNDPDRAGAPYRDLKKQISATEDYRSCCRQACHCEEHSSMCEDNWLEQGEGGHSDGNWLAGCDDANKNHQSLLCLLTKGAGGGRENLCPLKTSINTVGAAKIPGQEHITGYTDPTYGEQGTGWRKAFDAFECTAGSSLARNLFGFYKQGNDDGGRIEVYGPIKASRIPANDVCNASLDRASTSGYLYSTEAHTYKVEGDEVKYLNSEDSSSACGTDVNGNGSDYSACKLHPNDPQAATLGSNSKSCPCQYFHTHVSGGWNSAKSKLITGNAVYDALKPVVDKIITHANEDTTATVPDKTETKKLSLAERTIDGGYNTPDTIIPENPCSQVGPSPNAKYVSFCANYDTTKVPLSAGYTFSDNTCSSLRYEKCMKTQSKTQTYTFGIEVTTCATWRECRHSNCGSCLGYDHHGICNSYPRCRNEECGCETPGTSTVRHETRDKNYMDYHKVWSNELVTACEAHCRTRDGYITSRWNWKNDTEKYCKGEPRPDGTRPSGGAGDYSTTPDGNYTNPLYREEFICRGVSQHLLGGAGSDLLNDDGTASSAAASDLESTNANNRLIGSGGSLPVCCAAAAAKNAAPPTNGDPGKEKEYYLGPRGKIIGNTPDGLDGVLGLKSNGGTPANYTPKPHVCFKSLPSRKAGGPYTEPPPPPSP